MINIDCVEMMHKGAEEVKKVTDKLSREEELKFWQQKTEALKKYKENLIKNRGKS